MRRFAAPGLVFFLTLVALCLFVVIPAAGTAPAKMGGSTTDDSSQQGRLIDAGNSQRIMFELGPNGDAMLVVSFVFDVSTEAERAAFRDTASEFKRTGFVWPFFNNTVNSVREHTGRDMSLQGPRRTVRFDEGENVAILRSQMTWKGFGNVSNGTVTVEDAFYIDDGVPWIRQLGTNQSLVLVGPEGYEFAGAPNGPRFSDERLIWDGQQRFNEGDLRARWQSNQSDSSLEPVFAGLAALIGLLLVFYGVRRYSEATKQSSIGTASESPTTEPVADTDGGAPAMDDPSPDPPVDDAVPTSEDASTSPRGPSSPVHDSEQTEVATEESDEESEQETEDQTDEVIDPELLSDEERVERMLDHNGGRMKQANIVKETGWSNAKVSQLLSQMDEDERIDKLRIGRENLISLPDEDVTTLE